MDSTPLDGALSSGSSVSAGDHGGIPVSYSFLITTPASFTPHPSHSSSAVVPLSCLPPLLCLLLCHFISILLLSCLSFSTFPSSFPSLRSVHCLSPNSHFSLAPLPPPPLLHHLRSHVLKFSSQPSIPARLHLHRRPYLAFVSASSPSPSFFSPPQFSPSMGQLLCNVVRTCSH